MQNQRVLFVVVALTTAAVAYKKGPPIDEYPEICSDMSPIQGHMVDPLTREVPFKLTSESAGCYDPREPIVVKVVSINNKTYFEGFFVQARLASSLQDSSSTLHLSGVVLDGTFDTLGDQQLQVLACGNSSYSNAIGHRQAKRYYVKKFSWKPAHTVTDPIQFVATVVHEKDEYWMRVTSEVLRRRENCPKSGASVMSSKFEIPSLLSLVALTTVIMM